MDLWSISPTFYLRLFPTNLVHAFVLTLYLLAQENWRKSCSYNVSKLTPYITKNYSYPALLEFPQILQFLCKFTTSIYDTGLHWHRCWRWREEESQCCQRRNRSQRWPTHNHRSQVRFPSNKDF